MKNKKVIIILLVIAGLMMMKETREGHINRKAHDKAHENMITNRLHSNPDDGDNQLSDFNPPPKPEMEKRRKSEMRNQYV